MQAFVDFIVRNLRALLPIRFVNEWTWGMIVRGGKIRREIRGGWFWLWPFLDELFTYPATEVAIDLATGAITTSDDRAVAVSANLSYRVQSLATMYRALNWSDQSLKLIALGHITSECARRSWVEIKGDRAALEAALLESLNGIVRNMGIEIVRANITDCVLTRAHRHYLDGTVAR